MRLEFSVACSSWTSVLARLLQGRNERLGGVLLRGPHLDGLHDLRFEVGHLLLQAVHLNLEHLLQLDDLGHIAPHLRHSLTEVIDVLSEDQLGVLGAPQHPAEQ